jgi:CO dehydrogenase nickel-insertion accessory protein CooC1
MESLIMDKLEKLRDRVIGIVSYDQNMIAAALSGNPLGKCKSLQDVERILERLEQVIASRLEMV